MENDKVPNKKFDLEDRTLKFAKDCIDLCKLVIRDTINIELVSQLVRASGSIGANYREANDSITKKDFFYRIGICRREAKESKYKYRNFKVSANSPLPFGERVRVRGGMLKRLTTLTHTLSLKKGEGEGS